jgi:MazG family protein
MTKGMTRKGRLVTTSTAGPLFDEFLTIVRRLRRECPWDREQTHQSIRGSLLEETYELLHAIDASETDHLKEELGDLLLHIGLHSVIAEEEGSFSPDAVLATINEKLIRRHPHVFAGHTARDAEHVASQWEKSKLREGRTSVLEGVPKGMAALVRAHRIQEKVSKVGFDWKEPTEVWNKVKEELEELKEAEEKGDLPLIEEEFGDLLFAMVNYSRFLHANPELALQRSTDKFCKRFKYIEDELARKGLTVADASFDEMDVLWNAAKGASEK